MAQQQHSTGPQIPSRGTARTEGHPTFTTGPRGVDAPEGRTVDQSSGLAKFDLQPRIVGGIHFSTGPRHKEEKRHA
jgi:hypothetical protein